MSHTESTASAMPLLPPLPISECPETTSKVVQVRGLPFAVTRFQIRQFFRAFQLEEEQQPATHIHSDAPVHDEIAPVTMAGQADTVTRKALSNDSLCADNGESRTASNDDTDSSKHSTPAANTPRHLPRWSALTDMESSSIVWFPSGSHRGEGFIRLKHSEDVAKAVEFLDRNHFADRIIEVSASTEEMRQTFVDDFKQYMEAANKALVLRLRGLPFNAEEEDVRAFIRSIDGVVALDICRDASGRNTGDAFIELENDKSVAQAKLLHEKTMGRRYIEVLSSSAHDRLCVLRAAARKNSFVHPHTARHGPRFPRQNAVGAHHMFQSPTDAPYGHHMVYPQRQPKHMARGPHGQRQAGSGAHRESSFNSSYTSLANPYDGYYGTSAMNMNAMTGYHGTVGHATDMTEAGYDYGYYYYPHSAESVTAAPYQLYSATNAHWDANTANTVPVTWASHTDTPATGKSAPAKATNSPTRPHSTGKTHNPYGYHAIEGPSAVASWDSLCEAASSTMAPVQ